jgi:hypothetical protein
MAECLDPEFKPQCHKKNNFLHLSHWKYVFLAIYISGDAVVRKLTEHSRILYFYYLENRLYRNILHLKGENTS